MCSNNPTMGEGALNTFFLLLTAFLRGHFYMLFVSLRNVLTLCNVNTMHL